MAYQFPSSGDDVSWSVGMTTMATGQYFFVYGWWKPTTSFQSARGLWSIGNITGLIESGTSGAMALITDNTTDSQYTTPILLALDVWSFIAVIGTPNNTGPAISWRMWHGGVDTAPEPVTLTLATAPVGNFVGSSTFTVGNRGTGTANFPGWAADVGFIATDRVNGATTNPFGITTAGTITAAEEEFIRTNFVLPAWEGNYWWMRNERSLNTGVGGTGVSKSHLSFEISARPITHVATSTIQPLVATFSVTHTGEGGPRRLNRPPDHGRGRRS